MYKGIGTVSKTESGPQPSAILWALKNGTTAPLGNLDAQTVIQLPDLTLITGCNPSGGSSCIYYSPAPDEGQTTWLPAEAVAGEGSKNYVDMIQADNGDVLIAGSGTGTGTDAGGVWLSGDKGRNWMRISQGFNSSSQALEDIVADSGTPVSYYASTDATGLWTRTITASPYPTITGITPNNGDDTGGTPVTITGTGFSNSCPTGTGTDCPDNTPIVIFGDTEVAGTWVSPGTSVTATTPAHSAGAVTVKVRNPDTRESVFGVSYTFNSTCSAPSGMANNTAVDLDACADSGIFVEWSNPADWGDGGSGTRTYDILRDAGAIATGLSEGTLMYIDASGENMTTYTYSVRANNGCGESYTTVGAVAGDFVCVPPEVATGTDFTWASEVMSWTAEPTATDYWVYRGLKGELAALCDGTADFCTGNGGGLGTSHDTSADIPSNLDPTNRCLYYLITAENAAGEGTAGDTTNCGERQVNTTGLCP